MGWKFKYYDVQDGPDWSAIEQNCEWFRDMKGVPQDEIWHAEGNVQIHTKMVCEALISLPEFNSLSEQDKHIMFVGALMHDIEKRSTTTTEFKQGRECIIAPKHAERGEKTARTILYKEYDCPYDVREQICKIVKWHGKPLHEVSDNTMHKLAWQVKPRFLAMIAKADILGRTCSDADEHLERIEYFLMQAEELHILAGPLRRASKLAEYEFLQNGNTYYEPFDESKFEVMMMSAIAGSGKDTYIQNYLYEWNVVSLDDIRKELKVKPTDKSGNGRVIQLAKERAKEFMRKKQNFVWNATNITAQMRMQLIELFESYGGKVTIVYVEVPYKTLVKQNNSREDVVPQAIIDKMVDKLEPPTREEAYNVITFYT